MVEDVGLRPPQAIGADDRQRLIFELQRLLELLEGVGAVDGQRRFIRAHRLSEIVTREVDPADLEERHPFQRPVTALPRDSQCLAIRRLSGTQVTEELMEEADGIEGRAFQRPVVHAPAERQHIPERCQRSLEVTVALQGIGVRRGQAGTLTVVGGVGRIED